MTFAKSLVAAAVVGASTYQVVDSRSSLNRRVIPRLTLMIDPEDAHRLAILALAWGIHPRDTSSRDPILSQNVWGLRFDNPIGIAAGFDKHAEAIDGLQKIGFGYVEVGSVTPIAQPGNPRPRVFRLPLDEAVINRYGFNSDGMVAVASRLAARTLALAQQGSYGLFRRQHVDIPVGINLGKNREQTDDAADFVAGISQLGPHCNYIVVNVSSPNTPGLRDLQGAVRLKSLLVRVTAARDQLSGRRLPVLVKIAPDVSSEHLADMAQVLLEAKIDGIIVSNSTMTRPSHLVEPCKSEIGGLSGKPLRDMSTQALREMYRLTGGAVPIIGVGGIASARDAYEKIRSGASLVQLYTSLAYVGVSLLPDIKTDLAAMLRADGFENISQAVGFDVPLESKPETK